VAIAIREYIGQEGIDVDWNYKAGAPLSIKEGVALADDPIDPNSIMVDIEGIHVGPTRNHTWYTEEALKSSVPTWTQPYHRPLIMFHNEKDGKIIGRIRSVIYTDVNTKSNTGALVFTANVPDKDGKEQIQDGRLKTVSIGAIVHDARCSICGQNIAEHGPCDHELGQTYAGQICYWMIYKMEAKELSYVIVPSDVYAQNLRVYKPSKNKNVEESFKEGITVAEATKIDPVTGQPIVTEGAAPVIVEDGDKPAAPAAPAEPTPAPAEDFKAKYEAEKAEKERLEGEVKTLKADKEAADEKIKGVQKDLEDTKVLLDTAQKNLKTASDNLVIKEAACIQERQLREAAEGNTIKLQTEVKESLIDRVELLRANLGKPVITREELSAREEISLRDAIRDLKEEASKGIDVNNIQKPVDPTVIENTNSDATHVKEQKSNSNMSVSEQFEDILSNLMKPKFH
jgi:hypothetical protein